MTPMPNRVPCGRGAVSTLAAKDPRVLMEALQDRITTLDKLIAEESRRRWTTESVLRADRSLLIEALMLVAETESART